MEFISKLYNQFLDLGKQRLKNPLISAFIVSWVIVNWKPLAVLIYYKKGILEKISTVTMYSEDWSLWLYPLICSIFYTVFLPMIMVGIDKATNWAIILRKVKRSDIIQAELKNELNLLELKNKIERSKADNQNLEELNNKISTLESDLKQETELRKQKIEEYNKIKEDLKQIGFNDQEIEYRKMYVYLKNVHFIIYKAFILGLHDEGSTMVLDASKMSDEELEILMMKGIIKTSPYQGVYQSYELTRMGKAIMYFEEINTLVNRVGSSA